MLEAGTRRSAKVVAARNIQAATIARPEPKSRSRPNAAASSAPPVLVSNVRPALSIMSELSAVVDQMDDPVDGSEVEEEDGQELEAEEELPSVVASPVPVRAKRAPAPVQLGESDEESEELFEGVGARGYKPAVSLSSASVTRAVEPLFRANGGALMYIRAREQSIKSARNQREVCFIADWIDLLRAERLDVLMEAMVRRLVGVMEADARDNWSLASALDQRHYRIRRLSLVLCGRGAVRRALCSGGCVR